MIILVDNQETGHHKIYQKNLEKIESVHIMNNIIEFKSVRENYIQALKQRKKFLNNISKMAETNALVHLLYIDSLYKCPVISRYIDKKCGLRYVGTLHWIPENKLMIGLLKRFCKKLEFVIVHSEYLKEKVKEMGIKNVRCIEYPSFIKKNLEERNYNSEQKIRITCLGGTRSDKGLDVLIKSFKYITNVAKKKIVINVAGIEQCIKYSDLKLEADKYNIEVQINNKFLSDEEYEIELYKSDVVLLPYKKNFKGNSGPMTDGVYANKYILGPNEGNLGYLINRYNLGDTFEIENEIDLAKKISELIDKDLRKKHKYSEKLTVTEFIEKHKEIYKEIEGKR